MFCEKPRILVCLSVLAMVTALATSLASADIVGTYVQATTSNTSPGASIISTGSVVNDNLWFIRSDHDNVIESFGCSNSTDGNEDAPKLTTTVSGLADGTYNVNVIYWARTDTLGVWNIQAGLAGNPLTVFTHDSPAVATGATLGDGSLAQMSAPLGQVTVTNGSFAVDIDDRGITNMLTPETGDNRTWYAGVSYQATPEPSTLVLAVTGLFGLLAYAWRKCK